MTGPLCDESMMSLGPEVRVWRHVSLAWEPAATVMTFEVAVVGLGPPLQTMSLEVTSVMGLEGCQSFGFEIKGRSHDGGKGRKRS
jgi:hypothetical protein